MGSRKVFKGQDGITAQNPRAHASFRYSSIFLVHLNVSDFSFAVFVGWIGLPIKVVFLLCRCWSPCNRWGRCFNPLCCRAPCTNEQNREERGQKGNQTLNRSFQSARHLKHDLGILWTHTHWDQLWPKHLCVLRLVDFTIWDNTCTVCYV